MDLIITFFGSFLAATVIPFSSEAILIGFLINGSPPLFLLLFATLGNSLGAMFNFYIGKLGHLVWAEKYLKIRKESIYKFQKNIIKHGALLGFFCWLPVIGDPLSLALGFFRVPFVKFVFSMCFGKFLRYFVIIYLVNH